MSSHRVRMRKPKGATRDGLFPITFDQTNAWDFLYGLKRGGRLMSITSRNKCAWLWCELWRSAMITGDLEASIDYALALHLVECHARRLDLLKREGEWDAILKGKRWSEGIVFPGEKKEAFLNIVLGELPMHQKEMMNHLIDKEETIMLELNELDFVLTGHDMALGQMWPEPPDWATIWDCAVEIGRRNADAFVMHAEADGFEPRKVD